MQTTTQDLKTNLQESFKSFLQENINLFVNEANINKIAEQIIQDLSFKGALLNNASDKIEFFLRQDEFKNIIVENLSKAYLDSVNIKMQSQNYKHALLLQQASLQNTNMILVKANEALAQANKTYLDSHLSYAMESIKLQYDKKLQDYKDTLQQGKVYHNKAYMI